MDSNDTDGIDAFELFGDDPTQYQRVAVGANGTFATYVEQGSYTLIVEDRTVENVTETLRQRLIVDRGQTMNLNTIIASEIDLVLEEAVTGTELEGFFLRADSQDELGTITLDPRRDGCADRSPDARELDLLSEFDHWASEAERHAPDGPPDGEWDLRSQFDAGARQSHGGNRR